MIKLKDLVQTAAIQLYDESQTNWSEPELVFWINEGLRALAGFRPDLFTKTEEVELDPGSKQSIPSNSARIVRVLGTRETSDGPMRSVTRFDMQSMSAAAPNWEDATPGRARQYTTRSDAYTFWLYPPQPDPAHFAVIEHIQIPTVPEPGDTDYDSYEIDLDARFQRALLDYTLYRAYSKDADVASQSSRAQVHYQAFNDAITAGMQQQAERATTSRSQ